MQYKYLDEKSIEILCEDKLEDWFWENMYHAIINGDVKFKLVNRSFFEEKEQKQNEYLVLSIKRD